MGAGYDTNAGRKKEQQLMPNGRPADYARAVQQAQTAQAPQRTQAQAVQQPQAKQAQASTAKANKTISIGAAPTYVYGQDPGNYTNRFGAMLDDIYNQIQNRKTFNYEFNADPLFQAYKDMYVQHGKQAMMDTMGQAQTMTGGYGNSYAQNVGQQTYQQYMLDLNNKGLEMRDRAYQLNQDELANLYNMAGLYQNAEALDYDRYNDAMAAYQAAQASGGGRGRSGGGEGRYFIDVGDGKLAYQDQFGQWRVTDVANIQLNANDQVMPFETAARNTVAGVSNTLGTIGGTIGKKVTGAANNLGDSLKKFFGK